MKRFGKIFSGIAAIMLGVGIILVAVGYGRAKADWERFRENQREYDVKEQEFSGVGSVEMDLPFGYLYVGTSPDGKVHFRAEHVDGGGLLLRQEGEALSIRMEGGESAVASLSFMAMGWGVAREEFALQEYQLLLPGDYSGRLNVSFGFGKLWMDGVKAGEMDLSLSAGELSLDGCSALRLDAKCDLGSSRVEGSFDNITVRGNVGDLEVNLYGSKEDYDGVVGCDIGEIRYWDDGSHMDWRRREGGIGVRKSWAGKNARGKLLAECDLGSVKVSFGGFIQEATATTDTGMWEDQEFDPSTQHVPVEQVSGTASNAPVTQNGGTEDDGVDRGAVSEQ